MFSTIMIENKQNPQIHRKAYETNLVLYPAIFRNNGNNKSESPATEPQKYFLIISYSGLFLISEV